MLRWPFFWNHSHPVSHLLVPVAMVYSGVIRLRRWLYQRHWLKSYRAPVPVIVVGNITAGGAGKTPFVIWLVSTLRGWGLRVAVVSRGYGGRSVNAPLAVVAQSDPRLAGDEAVMLAQRTGGPVYVDRDRARAVRRAVADGGCDIVVADDGLQHYALERDIEIALVDGERRFGNGRLLPAGPLREPLKRLEEVDFVVTKSTVVSDEMSMVLLPTALRRVGDCSERTEWDFWRGKTVHAVAGIGYPPSFFALLRDHGLIVIEHPFPDHYPYQSKDIEFGDGLPVFMTEKDAVKCRRLASAQTSWYVEVSAQLPAALGGALAERLGMGLK